MWYDKRTTLKKIQHLSEANQSTLICHVSLCDWCFTPTEILNFSEQSHSWHSYTQRTPRWAAMLWAMRDLSQQKRQKTQRNLNGSAPAVDSKHMVKRQRAVWAQCASLSESPLPVATDQSGSPHRKKAKKNRLKPKQPGVLKRLFFMLTDQSQDPPIPSTCQTTECFPAQILCSFTLSVWDTSNLCWLIKSWMRWAQRGRLTCWLLCVVLYPPVCMFSCCLAHSWNWHNRLLACNGQWDFSTKCIFEHGHNSQF